MSESRSYGANLTQVSAPRGLVAQIRREPALRFFDRLPFALRVRRDLILAKPSDGEVPRVRAREVQAADAGGRRHRRRFGQVDADRAGAEELEQLELLAVIGTRGIPERRPDAAMLLGVNLLGAERFVDPGVAPRHLMEVRGKRLRQAIGDGLDEDRAVIVMLALEAAR